MRKTLPVSSPNQRAQKRLVRSRSTRATSAGYGRAPAICLTASSTHTSVVQQLDERFPEAAKLLDSALGCRWYLSPFPTRAAIVRLLGAVLELSDTTSVP
jgi:hypothetical protein